MKEKIKVTLPFTMTFNEALKYKNVKFSTAKEDINYTGKWYFYECTYEITNNQLFGMPMTGDDGKWKYGFIGFAGLSIINCGFILHNKSKKKKRLKQKNRVVLDHPILFVLFFSHWETQVAVNFSFLAAVI